MRAAFKVLANDPLYHLVYPALTGLKRAEAAKDHVERKRLAEEAETKVAAAIGMVNRGEGRA